MRLQKRGFIVAFAVCLLVFFSFSIFGQTEGCYFYPQGGSDVYCVPSVSDTLAEEDCAANADCEFTTWFKLGSDCSEIPECRIVTCDTTQNDLNCKEVPLGTCQQAGGDEIPAEQVEALCTPGCCVVNLPSPEGPFCAPQLLDAFECKSLAGIKQGANQDYSFDNSFGITKDICLQQCGITQESGVLQGSILDQAGAPIANALVELTGVSVKSITTGDDGAFLFTLPPAIYFLQVSKPGYQSGASSISISAGGSTEQNITLTAIEVGAMVTLTVLADDQPLEGATIAWQGPVKGAGKTGTDGRLALENVPSGQYTFIVSKLNFASQQRTLTLQQGENAHSIILEKAAVQGIKGTSFVENEEAYDVNIYIDGAFRGKSQYPAGTYSISMPTDDQEHTIFAAYHSFVSDVLTFTIKPGQQTTVDLFLFAEQGECVPGSENEQKNVESFVAQHVPGKKQVFLKWNKPCQEVATYTIERSHNNQIEQIFSASLADISLLDTTDMEWGETYTYSIIAHYESTATSANAATATITLGDAACEKQYDQELQQWNQFCLVDDRQTVFTCDGQNQLVGTSSCQALGSSWFCSQVSDTFADCKDAGMCALQSDPFNLYGTRDTCYAFQDSAATTYCYYDYSDTIADQCNSCEEVENCFDYQSKDACEVNNCLSSSCEWVDAAANKGVIDYGNILPKDSEIPLYITPETGSGYCVEQDYAEDDFCSLCSPTSTLFSNYYCTAEVCSALGDCFANNQLTSCDSCGEYPTPTANCYSYTTEQECVGAGSITKNDFEELSFSGDTCGWGTCAWDGGQCVKNADANLDSNNKPIDDCLAKGSKEKCQIDNTAPETKLLGIPVISLANPTLQFKASDLHTTPGQTSTLGSLYYCLTAVDTSNSCTNEKFIEMPYGGSLTEEILIVPLVNYPYSNTSGVSGNSFTLKYYSKDIYNNQEPLREDVIFFDITPPPFTVNQVITTENDITTVTVFLENTEEAMSCSFSLVPLLPQGVAQTKQSPRSETNKQVEFSGLQAVKAELTVSCQDDRGNINELTKIYTFQLEQNIELVSPAPGKVLATTSLPFEIKTTVGATCQLYDALTNNLLASFITDETGKSHITEKAIPVIEKDYAGDHKVVCTELLSTQTHEALFDFAIDFTPPKTSITLTEGTRIATFQNDGWESSSINSAVATLNCVAEGIPCDKTFVCLGTGCSSTANPNYVEYTAPFAINKTTELCYYSTHQAIALYNDVNCGKVLIEGYGITLTKPTPYVFNDEIWGVSNSGTFDWQFFTKVPTTECKFDFVEDFSYETTPPHKTRLKNTDKYYQFENFPASVFSEYDEDGETKTVFVQCKDTTGSLSPKQQFFLEYDPTPPVIENIEASPNPVFEGISVTLSVSTDDKSICSFVDYDSGTTFYFPGYEENVLDIDHESPFYFKNFVGSNKTFLLGVQCANGAGDLSGTQNISVLVDYAAKGSIATVYPSGEHFKTVPTAKATTTKTGYCEYKKGTDYVAFDNTNSIEHSLLLNESAEGIYTLPFRCVMGDHLELAEFTYVIDHTPPVIDVIEDGNYSCGLDQLNVMVTTEGETIAAYHYEVYDQGIDYSISSSITSSTNVSTASASSTFALGRVYNATVDSTLPITIPLAEFAQEGHKYVVHVFATDKAGNQGKKEISDGVTIVSANYSACEQDTDSPLVLFSVENESSCKTMKVSLQCNEDTACSPFEYGISPLADTCEPNLPYNGNTIELSSSNYVCYRAADPQGQETTGSKLIPFTDSDSDGIANSCDQCAETLPGKVVDMMGCAEGQVPPSSAKTDSDKDGLPDAWETQFNSLACQLNPEKADSDGDGVLDGDQDHDGDGATTYQEFFQGTNPCQSEDKPPTTVDEKEPAVPATPPPPSKENNLLAWIIFIMGLSFICGGVGYLIYYYHFRKKPEILSEKVGTAGPISRPTGLVDTLRSKLTLLQKRRREARQTRQRKDVFKEFSEQSREIPHITKALSPRKTDRGDLRDVAQTYAAHKKEIDRGLQPHERDVFSRLGEIAQKTKKQDVTKVVSKDEAKNIFAKLRKINKKRKK